MQSVSVGNPLETGALVGPLIDKAAFDDMQKALEEAARAWRQGAPAASASRTATPTAYYVQPALVEMPKQVAPVRKRPSRRSSM